jgi:peptidoglycan-associated lipoprotein
MIPALSIALVAAVACSKKAPETAPAPAANADSVAKARAADSAKAAQAAAAAAAKAHDDSIAKVRTDSIAAVQQRADMLKSGFAVPIYFDFDKSTLTDTAKAVLDKKIKILNANPSVTVQIEGHTDERGSSEYNMALGQRRAASVKRYLTQHGIADSRIMIISYGEEKPAAAGHDETSWSQNRRAEFVITVGQLSNTP